MGSQLHKYRIHISVVIVALALFAVSINLLDSNKPKIIKPPTPLAQIKSVHGSVEVKTYDNGLWSPLKKVDSSLKVHHLDQYYVHSESSFILLTPKKSEIEIGSESQIIVESWDTSDPQAPLYIFIQEGDYIMKKYTRGDKVYVIKDDSIFNSEEKIPYITFTSKKSEKVKLAPKLPKKEDFGDHKKLKTLSNEFIDKTFSKQKSKIQRCQINRVQEVGLLKGKIILGVKIISDGEVGDLKVLKNEPADDPLIQCLKTVIYRMKFPPFSGASIYRSYPIVFQ